MVPEGSRECFAGAANVPQGQTVAQPMSKTALHGQEISMNVTVLGSCSGQTARQLMLFTLGKGREAEISEGWGEQLPKCSASYSAKRLIGAMGCALCRRKSQESDRCEGRLSSSLNDIRDKNIPIHWLAAPEPCLGVPGRQRLVTGWLGCKEKNVLLDTGVPQEINFWRVLHFLPECRDTAVFSWPLTLPCLTLLPPVGRQQRPACIS